MSNRISALLHILQSPARILTIVLLTVFAIEVAVMFVLPHLVPAFLGEPGEAVLDAVLLTAGCAPALWWIIIGPLRRIAIQEQQRSETIVANASEGILTIDRSGMLVSCNRAGTSLFERQPEQLLGQSISRVIPGLPNVFDQLPCEYRLEGLRASGDRFPLHVAVSDYPSEMQPLYIAIVRDLTEAHQAEQERINMARQTEALRTQQMATLAQLATGVAHEIRNPLTSIKMLIQVNSAKFAEMGLPTSDMDLVEQEIRRMERSVNSLLDYARPEKGEYREFEIQETVRRALQLVAGRCVSQHVRIAEHLPATPIRLWGDPAQIQQLLLNLALNALDAMPAGGELQVHVLQTGQQLEIAVADTGDGIADELKDKLFSPFVTSKPNGVGLGLGVCRRIAEAHQGTLEGHNRTDGGAEFRLLLPLSHGDQSSFTERLDAKPAGN